MATGLIDTAGTLSRIPAKSRQWTNLLSLSDDELARTDPLEMNLLVAKGVPSLSGLNIAHYRRRADQWADEIRNRLPAMEREFRRAPQDWKNCIHFFRLGVVCWYVDRVLDIAYREDQRNLKRVLYTDPSDLFLNGVMDTRRGTCGNMSLLHVVLGRRLGWPVSLACVGPHLICRYDDGRIRHNIEATNTGRGGFSSRSDDEYRRLYRLPEKAVRCGSDLRAVTPREMLGLFIGARARHLENVRRMAEAEGDYLLARHFFPQNRTLHIAQIQNSVQYGMQLFEPHEKGHPTELAEWLRDVVRIAPWRRSADSPLEQEIDNGNVSALDSAIAAWWVEADRNTD